MPIFKTSGSLTGTSRRAKRGKAFWSPDTIWRPMRDSSDHGAPSNQSIFWNSIVTISWKMIRVFTSASEFGPSPQLSSSISSSISSWNSHINLEFCEKHQNSKHFFSNVPFTQHRFLIVTLIHGLPFIETSKTKQTKICFLYGCFIWKGERH